MAAEQPLCVFVHGWGMNHAIWQPVIEALPSTIECVAVDLPGHGMAAQKTFDSLDDLVAALASDINRPAIWIGWSLGGLAVMQMAAKYPQQVQAMLLVASTPCFVKRDDWNYGMPQNLFDGFADELEADYENTIRRFLTLQVKDSAQGRQILKQIRQRVLQQPAASVDALRAGLEVLKTTDLRDSLAEVNVPVAISLGEQDRLVNAVNAEYYRRIFPGADVQCYAHASHAPFLSCLPEFTVQLMRLIKTVEDAKS